MKCWYAIISNNYTMELLLIHKYTCRWKKSHIFMSLHEKNHAEMNNDALENE